MRITIDLEPADIARLQAALLRSRKTTLCADEVDVIEAAKYALDHLETSATPTYVRKRLVEVQRLILMLEDDAWSLCEPERGEVVETLAYFSDPDDLIPDHIEVIGLLDDAIMLELLLQKMRGVRRAYNDFCAFRIAREAALANPATRPTAARELAERRRVLHARMRRQDSKSSAPSIDDADDSGSASRLVEIHQR